MTSEGEQKGSAKKALAIQDTYGKRFRHCWGCGADNPDGLHIRSYPAADGKSCLCRFTPAGSFTGGVPDHLFGGLIATLFDCHGTASAAWFYHAEKGLRLTEDTVITRFITARLEIDFRKPLPMGEEIRISAYPKEIGERKVLVAMEMEAAGSICAQAQMVAVRLKEEG